MGQAGDVKSPIFSHQAKKKTAHENQDQSKAPPWQEAMYQLPHFAPPTPRTGGGWGLTLIAALLFPILQKRLFSVLANNGFVCLIENPNGTCTCGGRQPRVTSDLIWAYYKQSKTEGSK